MYNYIGFESGTGLLLKDRPDGCLNPQERCQALDSENIDKLLEDLSKQDLSASDHVKQLTELLDLAILHKGWSISIAVVYLLL